MKKIIVLMILIISSVYGEPSVYLKKLEILEGKEYQVCRDYAENANNQFIKGDWWSYKFRTFKDDYEKVFDRPKWKKLEVVDKNLTLFKRLIAYQKADSINDYEEYWKNYVNHNQIYFYKAIFDIDSDGEDEILIRIFNDGSHPKANDYAKAFIVFMAVVNEKKESINYKKTQMLMQPFDNYKKFDGSFGPHDDLETDTNVFIYKEKKYLDCFWKRLLEQSSPLIKIVELTQKGQVSKCLLQYHYSGFKNKKK